MYSIIKTGGNQYKVSLKQKIEVDKLSAKAGEIVKFPSLLVVDGDKAFLGPEASKIIVAAKVLRTYKGKKVDISRFHHKTRHRRHIGFRPMYSELEIMSIGETKIDDVKPRKTKPKEAAKIKKTT